MALGSDDLVLCAGTVMATPFLDRLGAAAAAGYTAVGIMPHESHLLRGHGVSDAELRSHIADHGLRVGEVDAITTWFDGHEPPAAWGEMGEGLRHNTAANVCPVGEALGARSVTVCEFYGTDVDVDRAAEGFAAVCDTAAQHGLVAHLEFLPWAGVPNLATANEIVSRAGRPNGGILLDSWHMFRSGGTLDELALVRGDRILNIQLDDAPAQAEADLSDETQHRRLLPGEEIARRGADATRSVSAKART